MKTRTCGTAAENGPCNAPATRVLFWAPGALDPTDPNGLACDVCERHAVVDGAAYHAKDWRVARSPFCECCGAADHGPCGYDCPSFDARNPGGEEPNEQEPLIGECRWCGKEYIGGGDDCGCCPLTDEQCEHYNRRRTAGVA